MQRNKQLSSETNGFASNSFAKGLAVLQAFDAESPFLSMAEIARRTGQDRATARRGILTLETMGFLQRKGRLFTLSPKVLVLAGHFVKAARLQTDVLPILTHFSAQTGTDLCLATLIDNKVLILCHARSAPGSDMMQPNLGTTFEPFNNAMGRVLLASHEDNELHTLLQGADLLRRTPHSLTSASEVLQRIKASRTDGYATDKEEHISGYMGYAVPVLTSAGTQNPLALGFQQLIDRDTTASIDKCLSLLKICAMELGQLQALATF